MAKKVEPTASVAMTDPRTGAKVTVEKDKADAYKDRGYKAASSSSK